MCCFSDAAETGHIVSQEVVLRMLQNLDYSVGTSTNGYEATQTYWKVEYYIVPMDSRMPETKSFPSHPGDSKRIRPQ